MGSGVAATLLRRGFAVSLLPGPRSSNVDLLLAQGARRVETARALAAECRFVLTSLPSSRVVEAVVEGEDGLLAGAGPGLTHIDLTSGDPSITAALVARYAASNGRFVDVALSGTPEHAAVGELTALVGADAATLADIEQLIRAFSRRIVHVGGPGSGHRIKLIMSFIGMAMANASAEALAVTRASGIELETLRGLIEETAMNSGTFQAMAKAAMDGDEAQRKITIAQSHRDIQCMVAMTRDLGVPAMIAPATLASLAKAVEQGHGSDFVPALTRLLAKS